MTATENKILTKLATIETDVSHIKKNLKTLESCTGDIKKSLNGKDGIIVQTELNKKSIGRLWGMVTASITAIFTLTVGAVIKLVVK